MLVLFRVEFLAPEVAEMANDDEEEVGVVRGEVDKVGGFFLDRDETDFGSKDGGRSEFLIIAVTEFRVLQ